MNTAGSGTTYVFSSDAAGVSPHRSRFFFVMLMLCTSIFSFWIDPQAVFASTLWQSTPTHPDVLPIFTPDQPHRWFGTLDDAPVMELGIWSGNDFTTTASTTLEIWAQWNGVSSNILDVMFRTANGNPFDGSATSTAYVIGDPGMYTIVHVTATTSLEHYSLPARVGEVIHHGDHLGTFLYPSYSAYGANHSLGALGTVPYLALCEGDCDATSTPPAPPCTHDCYDNVLFLPGIEGSRLYEGTGCGKSTEEKLWEPVDSVSDVISGKGDGRVQQLSLTATGESVCSDIYTKEGDILNTTLSGNLYQSFSDTLTGLQARGEINDWKEVSYDWRLSLDALLSNGTQHGNRIYYEEATSTPYIEQTLRALAASSKTGKVTIVAHSNGGLVAKALLNKLGPSAATLVDRVILVAVPQSGTPASVGSLLVGYNAGIYVDLGIVQGGITVVSNQAARTFAQNSPMAYHLLPSEFYLESTLNDTSHPVVRFSGSAYAKERAAYGSTISNIAALDNFLLAKEGGRTTPSAYDLKSPQVLNPALITYANTTHNTLDFWTPPAGIEVDQIAGWGIDTVQGIDFYSQPGPLQAEKKYRPIFVEDGDGTVTTASALMMGAGTNVKSYWIDLYSINREESIDYKHANLLESTSVRLLISNLFKGTSSSSPPHIQTSRPSSNSLSKTLTFFLHSPLTLQLTDASGNTTGLAADGSITETIPGSTYGQFGEVKYVTVPAGATYQLSMQGQDTGTFSLDMQETQANTVIASSTIANVPTTASTTATMRVPADITAPAPLVIDENGDGKTDATITPMLGTTVQFDTTPPEIKIAFATSTHSLAFSSTDDSGTSTLATSIAYPPLKKNQKEYKGTATTTVTARDAAGNTTNLVYTQELPAPEQRISITLHTLTYNNATTTLKYTSLSYKWRLNKDTSYKLFASFLSTPSVLVESHYRPKKGVTLLMTKPLDLDDTDDDDDCDVRPTKQKMSGMMVPYIKTQTGSVIIND